MGKIGRPRKNMIGEIFGKLTVIDQDSNLAADGSIQWICKCECGNIRVHSGTRLRKNKIKSCGCIVGPLASARLKGKIKHNHHSWKGYGEIPATYIARIKDGAQRRHLEFDITIEQIWDLFLTQQRKCKFSGVELKFNTKQGIYDGNASLDRIDSNKGYTIDNVQWIHKDLQHTKLNMSDTKFLKWVKIIYEYNQLANQPL